MFDILSVSISWDDTTQRQSVLRRKGVRSQQSAIKETRNWEDQWGVEIFLIDAICVLSDRDDDTYGGLGDRLRGLEMRLWSGR